MKQLSPTEIVQWFRDRAKTFNDIADMVESTFKNGIPLVPPSVTASYEPTVQSIKVLVADKARRIGDVATHLGTTKEKINELIKSVGSGLNVNERGWIQLNE